PINAGLPGDRRRTDNRDTRRRNLGVLPLSERAEQPDAVEQGPVYKAADRERLAFPQLDHLLGRGGPCTSQHQDRGDSEPTQRCHSRSHDTPSVKGAYSVDYPFTAPIVKPWMKRSINAL